MKWFLDLKIANKIRVYSAFVLFCLAITGFIGLYNNDSTLKDFEHLRTNNLESSFDLQTVKANTYQISNDLLQLMLVTDHSQNEALVADINRLRKADSEILNDYSKLNLSQKDRALFEELRVDIKNYRKAQGFIIDLALKNQNAAAFKLYLAKKDILDSFTVTLNQMVDNNKKLTESSFKEIVAQGQFTQGIILLCLVIAIVITLLFSWWLAKMLKTRFTNLTNYIDKMAHGDMSGNVKIVSNDEIGSIGKSLNSTNKTLRELITDIHNSVQDISASSEEMAASSEQTSQGAQQTSLSTQQLAQGAQEMSTNIGNVASSFSLLNSSLQDISEDAVQVADLGNQTEQNASDGNEHVKKAVAKIDSIKNVSEEISLTVSELGSLSAEIETIVDLIKNIAGQTNLLALNAAIEAARAGEHGKGFAVVADEVKKLAEQSADATDKITGMIKEIQGKTDIAVDAMKRTTEEVIEGVDVVNEAGNVLNNIIAQVQLANTKIQGISKEIESVAERSEEAVKNIENISAITEETAASAEEISSITEEQTASMQEISAGTQTLSKIAENLSVKVSTFKV